MSVINLSNADKAGAFKNQNYRERRVAEIRKVLLKRGDLFADVQDVTRLAVWLEATRVCVSSVKTNADFFHVPVRRSDDSADVIDFSDYESMASVILPLVEEERDAFQGEYDSEAKFAEELYTAETGQVDEDFPLYFAIDWQKVWDCSLRFDFDSVWIFDVDGACKTYFWRNV